MGVEPGHVELFLLTQVVIFDLAVVHFNTYTVYKPTEVSVTTAYFVDPNNKNVNDMQ